MSDIQANLDAIVKEAFNKASLEVRQQVIGMWKEKDDGLQELAVSNRHLNEELRQAKAALCEEKQARQDALTSSENSSEELARCLDEIGQLRKKLDAALADARKRSETAQAYKAKCKTLQGTVQDLEAKIKDGQQERDLMESAMDQKLSDYAQLWDKSIKRKETAKEYKAKVHSLEDMVQQLQGKLEAGQLERNFLETTMGEKDCENVKLLEDCLKHEHTIKLLSADLASQKEYKAKVHSLQDMVQQLQGKLEAGQLERNLLETTMGEKDRDNVKLLEDCLKQEHTVKLLRADLASQKATVKDLQAKLAASKDNKVTSDDDSGGTPGESGESFDTEDGKTDEMETQNQQGDKDSEGDSEGDQVKDKKADDANQDVEGKKPDNDKTVLDEPSVSSQAESEDIPLAEDGDEEDEDEQGKDEKAKDKDKDDDCDDDDDDDKDGQAKGRATFRAVNTKEDGKIAEEPKQTPAKPKQTRNGYGKWYRKLTKRASEYDEDDIVAMESTVEEDVDYSSGWDTHTTPQRKRKYVRGSAAAFVDCIHSPYHFNAIEHDPFTPPLEHEENYKDDDDEDDEDDTEVEGPPTKRGKRGPGF